MVTLFVHLIALIIFAWTSIGEQPDSQNFIVVSTLEEEVEVEAPKTLEEEIAERVNERIANLVANQQSESTSDRRSYSAQQQERIDALVKEELAKLESSTQSGLDSARANRPNEPEERDDTDLSTEDLIGDEYDWFNKSYNGSVTASVNVPGRDPIKIPIPGYKCKGGGTVVIKVVVGVQGNVIKAEIVQDESSDMAYCLEEEALKSANQAVFHAKSGAKKSEGTITYRFIPQ
ncbi:MAG: hypothetical protein HRT74_13965 [Flavobacteriales bacterium]|nr:hypothetical protein [Flavobacteriales bacterium]